MNKVRFCLKKCKVIIVLLGVLATLFALVSISWGIHRIVVFGDYEKITKDS